MGSCRLYRALPCLYCRQQRNGAYPHPFFSVELLRPWLCLVVQAYVGEITPRGKEGYTMGLFNMSMFASLSIGPIMGGSITDIWSMDAAFICMGLLATLGLMLSAFLLPPTAQEPVSAKKQNEYILEITF